MSLVFTLMLEMLLFLRAGAQSVTQPDDHIAVSEEPSGAEVQLLIFCFTDLFWYIQYPNQLQLLLKYVSGDNLVSGIKGFEAEFRNSETSFHLRKIPAHWKDSAKYFCALSRTDNSRIFFGTGTQVVVKPK
nr:T-cell receptor alpha chain precursor V region (BTA20) - bovine [Bos taurus]